MPKGSACSDRNIDARSLPFKEVSMTFTRCDLFAEGNPAKPGAGGGRAVDRSVSGLQAPQCPKWPLGGAGESASTKSPSREPVGKLADRIGRSPGKFPGAL